MPGKQIIRKKTKVFLGNQQSTKACFLNICQEYFIRFVLANLMQFFFMIKYCMMSQ